MARRYDPMDPLDRRGPITKPLSIDVFEHWMETWDDLAETGACDAWGSAECLRVTGEWNDAGFPHDMERFIRERANTGSGGKDAKAP